MGKHSKPTLVRLVGDNTTYLQVNDWKEATAGRTREPSNRLWRSMGGGVGNAHKTGVPT